MITLSPSALAWAAGFFDGEGTTNHHIRTRAYVPKASGGGVMHYSQLRLRVFQVSPFALHRFRAAVGGLGAIRRTAPDKRGHRQGAWEWATTNVEDSQAVIAFLWHWLGPEKRGQARAALMGHWAQSRKVSRLPRRKKAAYPHGG